MSTNALDPSALISLLPALLPPSSKTLSSPHDALAALVHTALSILGFRLLALDDSSPAATFPGNVLPSDWNTRGLVDRTLRYKHDQSSLEFVIKVIKLGQRSLINAIAVESDKSALLDICTNDFISPSFYPHNLSEPGAQPLVHGFISSNRITDFMSQFKLKIVQRLIPGLRKDGYTEEAEDSSSNSTNANLPRQDSTSARVPPPPAPDHPEDHPYRLPPQFPRNPLEIGRRDLDPFPSNPFAPPSLFPPHGGDGMFVGPEHPIFGFGDREHERRGPWGGDGFLPPMGAPPGARFDPIVPGSGPGRGGPLFPRRGGPGRGFGANQSGGPDNDEFMPPGAGDMFM